MANGFSHEPVMLGECVEALDIKPDGLYIDCTVGGGGHSAEILKRLTGGRLIAVDRDMDAINAVKERFAAYGERFTAVHANFEQAADILTAPLFNGALLDGALLDLGVSSHQLDTPERGFSYIQDAPLDMRMDRTLALTARDVVNSYDETELAKIIYKWGEERFAGRIAASIVRQRKITPIEGTLKLAEIVRDSIPAKNRESGGHPAKRTFQAIRIEVNRELDAIGPAILALTDRLKSGGRIAVITFHSLEDRIVKQTFALLEKGCTCPPDFPVCVCGKKPSVALYTRKPILPSAEELERNPRSHSAKLRAAIKI